MAKMAAVTWRKRQFLDGENGGCGMERAAVARWRKRQLWDGENGSRDMAKAAKKILTFCLIVLKMHSNY